MMARSRTNVSATPTGMHYFVIVASLFATLAIPARAGATSHVIQHFTASRSDLNLITRDWTVSGRDPSNLLYIYEDIGYRPQNCRSLPQLPGCSTTTRTTRGGFYRNTLSVRNAMR